VRFAAKSKAATTNLKNQNKSQQPSCKWKVAQFLAKGPQELFDDHAAGGAGPTRKLAECTTESNGARHKTTHSTSGSQMLIQQRKPTRPQLLPKELRVSGCREENDRLHPQQQRSCRHKMVQMFLRDLLNPWQGNRFVGVANDQIRSAGGMVVFIFAKRKVCCSRNGSGQFSLRRRQLLRKLEYKDLRKQLVLVADRKARRVTLFEVAPVFAICGQVAVFHWPRTFDYSHRFIGSLWSGRLPSQPCGAESACQPTAPALHLCQHYVFSMHFEQK
jgi:hypothetical protein